MQSILVKLLVFVVSGALLADSIGSNQTIYSNLGISSINLMYITLVILAFLRLSDNKIFHNEKFQFYLLIAFTINTLVTVALSIWDYFSPANFVYSLTRIQQQQLANLSLFVGFVLTLFNEIKWWKKNWQNFLFYSSLVLPIIFFIVSLWPMDYFLQIVKEDHLIENLQFLVLMVGGALLIYQLIRNQKMMSVPSLLVTGISAFIFIFLAGEEISWGPKNFWFFFT